MMKDIYKIDNEGIYKDAYKSKLKENIYYTGHKWLEIDFNYVETQPPIAKIVKWENDMWIIVEEYTKEDTIELPAQSERIDMLENIILMMMEG